MRATQRIRMTQDYGNRRTGEELELSKDVAESLVRQGIATVAGEMWNYEPAIYIRQPARKRVRSFRERLSIAWQILRGNQAPESFGGMLDVSQYVTRARFEISEQDGPMLEMDVMLEGFPLSIQMRPRREDPPGPSNPIYSMDCAISCSDVTRVRFKHPQSQGIQYQ